MNLLANMSFDDDFQSSLALAVINDIPGLVRRLLDFGGVDINSVPIWNNGSNVPFSPYQLSIIYEREDIRRIFLLISIFMEGVQVA